MNVDAQKVVEQYRTQVARLNEENIILRVQLEMLQEQLEQANKEPKAEIVE